MTHTKAPRWLGIAFLLGLSFSASTSKANPVDQAVRYCLTPQGQLPCGLIAGALLSIPANYAYERWFKYQPPPTPQEQWQQRQWEQYQAQQQQQQAIEQWQQWQAEQQRRQQWQQQQHRW